jgi:hypothetical protein
LLAFILIIDALIVTFTPKLEKLAVAVPRPDGFATVTVCVVAPLVRVNVVVAPADTVSVNVVVVNIAALVTSISEIPLPGVRLSPYADIELAP